MQSKRFFKTSYQHLVLICLGLIIGLGCGGSSKGSAPGKADKEALIRKVFEAIARDDLAAFQRVTVTASDFGLEASTIGQSRASLSYTGASLRPAEIQKQKEQFAWAVAGGAGQIDFRNTKFVGLGSLLNSGVEPALPQGSYAFEIYSINIEKYGQPIDTKDLLPKFKIVKWKGEPRLLRLIDE